MNIAPSTHVADIVSDHPATIAVFQRHHIAFCCGGHLPLEEVCAHEGLDVQETIAELRRAVEPFRETRDWNQAPIGELITHIEMAYHQPLYHELPRLAGMLAKVVQRHGDRFPDTLGRLRETFTTLERELVFHMRREDAVLFPAILSLAARPGLALTGPHPLAGPIAVMERDHAAADDALAEMRSLTGGYQPPGDACPTFRGLYFGLNDLAQRMRLHVHLENDILFPRALQLGRTVDARAAAPNRG